MNWLRKLFASRDRSRTASAVLERVRAERAALRPLAMSKKPGCIVARHKLQALTRTELEMSR